MSFYQPFQNLILLTCILILPSLCTVHSQNAAFGAAPTFEWLTKYRTRLGQSNPFAEDTFDPLKYMNLDGTNVTVKASDSDDNIFEGRENHPFILFFFGKFLSLPFSNTPPQAFPLSLLFFPLSTIQKKKKKESYGF